MFLTGAAASLGAATLAGCSNPSKVTEAPSTTAGTTPRSTKTTTNPTTTHLSPGGPAVAVSHGPRERPKVALTFHLGPNIASQDLSLAHELLAACGQLQAPITVFAVGQWLDEHRDIVPTILDGGNELDNHTMTHPTLTAVSTHRVDQEIAGCRDVLARLAPSEGHYFRPSGTSTATSTILTEAGAAGYRTVVDSDLDPLDYTDPGADAIVAAVRTGLQAGSIISLHFGHRGTIEALPRIVDALHAKSLRPVLLRELLA